MGIFGKSAKQARIDTLAFENGMLEADNTKLRADLSEARRQSGIKGRMADEFLSERDAARIERDTAQRERDDALVELRALKDARKRSNAPLAEWNRQRHLRALSDAASAAQKSPGKPTNGAAAQAVV